MKKVLLIIAMLLVVSPAMATVMITATCEGTSTLADGNDKATIRVSYSSDVNVRAFALDINVDSNCGFWNIRDFNVGENNSTVQGYGIFPGRFRAFISPITPNWGDGNYNPTPPWADPGTSNTGIGYNTVIVEMGYLGAPNIVGGIDTNAPALSGTLFRIDVNSYGYRGPVNLTILPDTMRGGVVSKDTNATTTNTNLPATASWTFPLPTFTISGNVVGAAAPRTGGISGLTIGGLPHSPIATNASGHYTDTVPQGFSGTVTVSDANGQWSFSPASWVYSNVTSNQTGNSTGTALECLNKVDTAYVKWVTFNKPDCWCYQKNCRGDADGIKTLGKPVAGPDLTIFKAAYNQSSAYVKTLVVSGKPGICADFDRLSTLGKPVAGPDLTIFKVYYNLADTSVPVCPSTTINAWKN